MVKNSKIPILRKDFIIDDYQILQSKIYNADAILLVGSNPKWEAAVLNSRIRKTYLNNNCTIGLIGKKIDLNYEHSTSKLN